MATMRLRYVHSFVDKTGRVRFYFRYRGKRWALPGEPGTPEFSECYGALRRKCLAMQQADNVAFGPGTVGLVIEKYLVGGDYTSKARGTQRHYRVALDRLKEICGRALIADLQERHIRQIRQRFTATSKADLAVMLLRMLWVFAKEVLAMDLGPNPATEIRRLRVATAQIGATACSAHGLRCNAATALIEAGCEVPQVMAITGHKTFKEAQRYASHRARRS